MDELELLASRAEKQEKGEADELKAELGGDQPEEKTAPPPEVVDAGVNRGKSILRMASKGLENFVDPRLAVPKEEIDHGGEEMGPALAKYGLTGSGTGSIPFEEEVRAGFFLGGFIKRIWKRIKLLAEYEAEQAKKRRNQELRQQHGEEPQYQTAEPAQSVSGEERLRQESDVAPPIVG